MILVPKKSGRRESWKNKERREGKNKVRNEIGGGMEGGKARGK